MDINDISKKLDTLYDSGKSEEAYSFLLDTLQLAMQSNDTPLVIFLCNELMGYYRVTTQFDLGNQVADMVLRIMNGYPIDDLNKATTYLNIATLYRAQGNYKDSLTLYHLCEEIYSQILDESDMRYASFYNNISLLYEEMGDKHKALSYELKALSIVEKTNNEFELAVTYSNLSQIYFSLNELSTGEDYVNKAVTLFEKLGVQDHHYFSSLSALAQSYYLNKDYKKSLEIYDQTLDALEKAYGKTRDYEIVLKNREKVEKEMNSHIGMTICRKYYETYGKKMLEGYSDYRQYIAVGLFGMGSECLGYDDEISQDHDYGPGFCIIIPDDLYSKIGKDLQDAYDSLPEEFMGLKRIPSAHGNHRVGVFTISEMFNQFINQIPTTLEEWLYTSEDGLLSCTNGKIFEDNLGEVTRLRKKLRYFPEDIRIKKLARSVAKMAQSGQYNYGRCMSRGNVVGASLALNEFVDQTLSTIYLLNKKYKPYYKWSFRGLDDCTILHEIKPLLEELVLLSDQSNQWLDNNQLINTNDQKVVLIEKISQKVITELHNQNLSDSNDDFLENHTQNIMNHINDPLIRSKHVLEG